MKYLAPTPWEWGLFCAWVAQLALATELFIVHGPLLQLKLWQLALAAGACGSLALRMRSLGSEHGSAAILLVGWATVAAAAMALFGQDLAWDLRLPASHTQSAGPAAGRPDVEAYIAVVALVLAGVTGFYLVVLHRTQDAAQKAVTDIREEGRRLTEDIRSNAQHVRDRAARFMAEADDQIARSRLHTDELEAVLGTGTTLYGVVTARHTGLLQETILPLLSRQDSLFRHKLPAPTDAELAAFAASLNAHVQRVQAEVSLFQLAEAPDTEHFLEHWEQVTAYRDMFKRHEFQPLFHLVRRRLTLFIARHDGDRRRVLLDILRGLEDFQGVTEHGD